VSRIEGERNDIKERKAKAQEDINNIYDQIGLDTDECKKREEELKAEA